ncbi:MAG: ABC transporter permease [Mesorhizobium sp.]|uniref:ABC transporter permease n=1 Tax=Mesorhizobium sp. TaxID=1871066 RepID=UPI000FE9FA0C|nr:ABC transporter permease [Mesorhizobium sp.]RWB35811.1 MAG: ABC transporter permease [Mesorhizobium sp.]RWD43168.1 MAG: ABC transporter permease [Mesorhizobium sp.]TIX74707.1 MAG: ABC transporter permease [Mesorhizobium sp.]TIY08556.1 MAG: ABC transporter permease [Mesorhizobium sp.]
MRNVLYRTLSPPSATVALLLVIATVGLAALGPWLSPFSYDEIVGVPFGPISADHWLGTDFLGRDAFSRFLFGGQTLLLIAVLATGLAFLIAVPTGIYSGLRRGLLDYGLIAVSDVIYALPPAIFLLVLLASTGPSLTTVVFGIVFLHVPRVLRIVRLITIDVSKNEFVEAAFARGEGWIAVCFRDILPNILPPVFADFGVRLCGSIILYASLSYLGLGLPPPAADWGMMISENRIGITISPWLAIAPALAIATFSVAVNVLADSFARSVGTSKRQ